MKLQKQKSREYKEKPYFKHWIVIPNKLIEKLKWKEKDQLGVIIKNKTIIIKKVE